SPMHQIARVMDLYAREPLERRGRDVEVIADPYDRWIRVEASQDGIVDDSLAHGGCSSRWTLLFVSAVDRRRTLAHERPQHGSSDEIEHTERVEERVVTDRGHETAEQQGKHQYTGIAARTSQTRDGSHFVSSVQVRCH